MKVRRRSRGFTLLELLVSATITLLLAGLLLVVLGGTSGVWRRSRDAMSSAAQAHLIFDLLERDLHGAIRRETGGACFAVDVIDDPAQLTAHGWLSASVPLKPPGTSSLRLLPTGDGDAPPRLEHARFGLAGAWLRFVTTNVESPASLPTVVSYQVVHRPVTGEISAANPAGVRYTLFRAAVSAEQTFVNGYAVDAAAYGGSSAQPAGTRAPATVTNPNSVDALAADVVDFGVWLHVRAADGSLRQIFPATGDDLGHAASGTVGASDAARFPDVVDVMVRILNEAGARQIENMEKGLVARPREFADDGDWWWSVVEANSRVFVRRIVVRTEAGAS